MKSSGPIPFPLWLLISLLFIARDARAAEVKDDGARSYAPPVYPQFETLAEYREYCRVFVHDARLLLARQTDDYFIGIFFLPPNLCAVVDMPRALRPGAAWQRRPSVAGRYFDVTSRQRNLLNKKVAPAPRDVNLNALSEQRHADGSLEGCYYFMGTLFSVEDGVKQIEIEFEDKSSLADLAQSTLHTLTYDWPGSDVGTATPKPAPHPAPIQNLAMPPGSPVPALSAATAAAPPRGFSEEDLQEITPAYPKPLFISTPLPFKGIPNLEKPDPEGTLRRLRFKVPKGAQNVALHKKVTSSDPLPTVGSLDLVTDGVADSADGCSVELSPGKQWVQIDLGASYDLWKILLWHSFKYPAVYFSVAVQISNDPGFKTGVTTVYNSDVDNALGLGAGRDPYYIETNHGRLIDARGTQGRYVRLWSKGNSANEMNSYVEVQVYGSPEK